MKQTLLFSAVAAILSTGALADTQTVTTQDYVDTAVATKQDKISASGTSGGQYNMPMPDSVITDTNTNGVVAKRPIIYGGTDGAWYLTNDWMGNALYQGIFFTQSAIKGMIDMFGYSDSDMNNALISAGVINEAFRKTHLNILNKQNKKVCVRWLDGAAETDENCLLWNLP